MSRGHQIARNDNNKTEADRKKHLPAQAHQLVVTIARNRRHDPTELEEEEETSSSQLKNISEVNKNIIYRTFISIILG